MPYVSLPAIVKEVPRAGVNVVAADAAVSSGAELTGVWVAVSWAFKVLGVTACESGRGHAAECLRAASGVLEFYAWLALLLLLWVWWVARVVGSYRSTWALRRMRAYSETCPKRE